MTYEDRIARCEREIEACRNTSGDTTLTLTDRVGAQLGELDWMVARQLLDEEHAKASTS